LPGFSGPLAQKWNFLGEKTGRGRAILTLNKLVLTFGGLHLCVQFGENRQRNATVRVTTQGQTDRQTETDFIICPMLYRYAIPMGHIINFKKIVINQNGEPVVFGETDFTIRFAE